MHYGTIEEDMHILHTCDNPRCVNPNHLYKGTHSDNMKDRKDRGRYDLKKNRRGQCLDVDIVMSIRDEYSQGNVTQKTLAIKYNVSTRTINDIVNHKAWKKA